MEETFVTLTEAAELEGLKYFGMTSRINRYPDQYKVKRLSRNIGAKGEVLVAVSSLSAKAQRAWRAAQKADGRDAIIDSKTTEVRPWYVDVDFNHYIEQHKRAYYEAVELANMVQRFIDYSGDEPRATVALRMATDLGISPQSLYRHQKNLTEAAAWALKLEQEDGQNRDYFKALALCRKPREKDTFPSLTDEQKAIIENIWFDRHFAENLGTVELLYEKFEDIARERSWEQHPSIKTVSRYVKHIMDKPGAGSAHYLAANGLREWKNKKQVKCKRDTHSLEVMEYVVADAHTFDVWVQYTTPNGKVKAIRPVLVAWLDVRSRRILEMILCEHSKTQIVKESFVKMVYEAGCVPLEAHMDNGKDFANHETLGQDRSVRAMDDSLMDAEEKGFYLSMGVKRWSRSLPFQPWDKPIERAFNTFCLRFSRKFQSYTGTLTASRTASKRKKDIAGMLERGELLTMDEFMEVLQAFVAEWYNVHNHRGLKDAGEQYITPIGVWENEPHIQRPAPPREYAAMLLMKPAQAKVTSQGITKFKTLYTADELAHYVDQKVGIRWDTGDVRKLYVYDKEGRKVCEAYSAELMQFGERVSESALGELHKRKNRQLSEVRAILDEYQTPPELRLDPSRTEAVGKLDLTIGHVPRQKVIALPTDKEGRSEIISKKKKSGAGDEFLNAKAGAALERLKAMNG